MGDDDIICLSSDDESTTKKLPSKRSNIILESSVKLETESLLCHRKDLKRKVRQTSGIVGPKKPKIDSNDSIEEIMIVSPQKDTNGESRSEMKNDESKQRAELSNVLKNNDLKKKSSKSSSHSTSRNFEGSNSTRDANPRIQDITRKSSISSDTPVSSEDNEISSGAGSHSMATGSKSKMENIGNGVRNIYAKSSQLNNPKSLSSRTLYVNEKHKNDHPETPVLIRQKIETQRPIKNVVKTQIDPGAPKTTAKSSDVCSSLPAVKSLHVINATKIGSTKNAAENSLKNITQISSRLSDILPDVQIMQGIIKSSSMTNEEILDADTNRLPKINNGLAIHGDSLSSVSKFAPNERKNDRIATSNSDRLKISEKTSFSSTSKNRQTSHERLKSSDVEIIVDTIKTPKSLSLTVEPNEAGNKSFKATNDRSNCEISSLSQISGTNEAPTRLKTINDKAPDRIVNELLSKSTEIGSYKNIEAPKSLSSKNMAEDTPNVNERFSTKSNDIQTISKHSKSPEIEIVHTIATSKSWKRPASDEIPNESEKLAPKSTDGETSRESLNKSNPKILKSSETSHIGSSRSTPGKLSKHEENEKRTSNSNSGSRETSGVRNLQKFDSPTVDSAKIDANREAKSTVDQLKSSSLNSEIVKKRITLQKVSELNKPRKRSNESISNDSDDQDGKKSLESKDQTKSKNFEPIPGCSKTPDAESPRTMSKETKRTKSSKGEDVQEKPQAECSKSSDKLEPFEKPHLVVKAKKSINQDDQDTFAMFLSLCLQTDRTLAMEKVVAKLKRLYEQMDPEYARSRLFRNFVDEKRDRIMAKGKAYYWIGQVVEEMKMRKQRGRSSKVRNDEGKKDEDKVEEPDNENVDEEDPEESERLKRKIKTIEKAMKQCQKRIHELEVAEVDFDDDNNSHYMKLDRYKEKMIELYEKFCEYTNEHADAGRAYLRPRHLRVSQIPSIDHAINSFINSKLSYNRKKGMKAKSFVEGLIFPDYVDILECVGRVNEQQKLGLNKRKQQQLAESAFTQLGKHLQESRQKDYWDTFSLNLENSEDPAMADPTLSEKLVQNQEIAEKKTREIFEEYVRKQDERKAQNYEENTSSASDQDDDDDDDEEDNDDEKDVKESSRTIESDIEPSEDDESDDKSEKDDEENVHMSENGDDRRSEKDDEDGDFSSEKDDEDDDRRSGKDNEEVAPNSLETIPEISSPKSLLDEETDNQVPESRNDDDDKTQENNNIVKTKFDIQICSSECTLTNNSIQDEAIEIEVNLAEVDTDDVIKAAVTETIEEPPSTPPPPLRIRSFAKPPSSWLNSQEEVVEISREPETSENTETIDVTDDETSTETSSKIGKFSSNSTPRNLNNGGNIVLDNRPIVSRPNNVQNSKIELLSRKIVPMASNSSNPTINTTNPAVVIARSSNKLSQNQKTSNLIKVQQANLTNTTISKISRSSKVSQKIRISTNTTNPMNVRLQVIPAKGPQKTDVQMINKTGPVSIIKQMQFVRLPNGSCHPRSSNSQVSGNSQLSTKSSNATSQMRIRMRSNEDSKVVQSNRTGNSQQVRPQILTVGNPRIINSSQAQILRFSNGQTIKANSAAFRPFETLPTQQRSMINTVASSTSTKNVQKSPIIINNPRFIKIPAASAAHSPELSQLRIERIENSPQRCSRLSNNECSSGVTLSQIVLPGQRVTPVLKPRMNENVPRVEQNKSGKRPGEKTWKIPPDNEPLCKN